ncbi:MAG TPA: CBS domain-containing protein [Ferrovibrio sp.]|uniref:CBS domain-containing protein n=1 Tax=Ferrovibrio sp. TaxID=1917215 RepID=UPI002ED579F8
MQAADIMTTRVETIAAEATLGQAIRTMLQKRISGLPVIDKTGALVGIVTEGDLLRRSEIGTERRHPHWLELLLSPGRLADEYVQSHARTVADVMTTDVVSATEDTPVEDLVELMEKNRIKRVPILRGGQVVGIVSRANLLHAFAGILGEARPTQAGDAAIRDRIMADMKAQPWAPKGSVNVVVRDGTVHLWGTIFDERERQALRVLAENTPGVKAVQDHLIWIEPMSGLYIEAAR